MNARAKSWLLVATAAAGIVLVALATTMSARERAQGATLTCTCIVDPRAELEIHAVSRGSTRARIETSSTSSTEFVSEPVFGGQLTIIAIDEEEHPVPGAVLQILEPDQADWHIGARTTAFEIDPLSEVRRSGTIVKCDERGCARIPRPSRNAAVLASTGELDAFESLQPGSVSPWIVTLKPHHSLEVRVWDERGAPVAGMPLAIHESDADELWRGATDATGQVVIDSLAYSLQWPDDVVVLTAAIPTDPPIERWLPGDLSSVGVVDLVIPHGSTVTVRTVDTHGRVLDMNDELIVYIPRNGPRAECETDRITVPLQSGVATIRGIPRGCSELVVETSSVNGQITAMPNGEWPPTIDIAVELGHALVRFRAVDPEGRPLAGRLIEWRQFDTEDGATEGSLTGDGRAATDSNGEFSCLVYLERDPEEENDVRTSLFQIVDAAAHPPLRGLVSVEPIRSSTRTEPFPVRLKPVPLAVSGRVLDESGAPVVDAYIDVDTEVGAGNPGHELETFAEVHTDALGRFAVFALPVNGPVTVNVLVDGVHAGVDDPACCVAFGTSDLELRACSLATIEGRLLVDPVCREHDIEIEALRGDQIHGDFEIWSEGANLHWRLRSLQAGTYELRVLVDEEPLCTIGDVRVPKGGLVLDPRCLPIDLRGRRPAQDGGSNLESGMRVLHIHDARGLPIDHGMWRYQVAGDWHGWQPWRGARVQVFDAFERVAVWSSGSMMRQGSVPARETTWTLEPARLVDVKFEIPRELRSSRLSFRAKAQLPYEEKSRLDWLFRHYEPEASLDSSGHAVLQFPVAARWQVVVIACWDVEGGSEGEELEWFNLTLGDESTFEPFVLEPDAKGWLATLRRSNAPIPRERD